MESEKIKIDPALLVYISQMMRRVPETLQDFQNIKKLSCDGRQVYRGAADPYRGSRAGHLELVRGDFSVIGQMPQLKKLSLSETEVSDFSFLLNCTNLEHLEISACGAVDCAYLDNLKHLKSLSLHRCPQLLHAEHILKLPNLVRLSLKGSWLQDVWRFVDCGIAEVCLPEHACGGIPFRPVRREQEQYPYNLWAFNSPEWAFYTGAYGDVLEYISLLMGDPDEVPDQFRLRRLESVSKTNYEIAFDNLCENLWHQMSFYPATWLALPYLAKLMERWEKAGDLEWMFRGILAAGSFLATDVYGDSPDGEEVAQSYRNAGMQIRVMTIDFLAVHMEYVRKKELFQKRELAAAVTAILGEQKLAYMLMLSHFGSCYIVCPACEACDEEIEFGYFDPDARIEAAKVPDEQWDGESLKDVRLWLFNLFALLEDAEGISVLRYFFGTYQCPQCGERVPVFKGMEEYYLAD